MEGVNLYDLKQIKIQKGNILHAFKVTDEGYVNFGEAYFSQIQYGAVKGWKRHRRFRLNIIVPVGEIKFVIFDDRHNSATLGQYKEYILSPSKNYKRLTVAPGLWMAFQGLNRNTSMLLDIIPELHTPDESDNLPLDSIKYNFNI